ncbi:hypothetical protein ABPG77_004753 [Micractinium sp. CCAP 211/92]
MSPLLLQARPVLSQRPLGGAQSARGLLLLFRALQVDGAPLAAVFEALGHMPCFHALTAMICAIPPGLFSALSHGRGDTLIGALAGGAALLITLGATTLLTLVALAAVYDWWMSTRR